MDYATLWENLQNKKFFTEIISKKDKRRFSGENCHASLKENPRNGRLMILLYGPFYKGILGGDFIPIKEKDIVDISLKIGTYETSVLPYEDCCTIFVAKHPVTKPSLKRIKNSEEKLGEKMEELVKTAIETREIIRCI